MKDDSKSRERGVVNKGLQKDQKRETHWFYLSLCTLESDSLEQRWPTQACPCVGLTRGLSWVQIIKINGLGYASV